MLPSRGALVALLPFVLGCCQSASPQPQSLLPFKRAKLRHKASSLSLNQISTLANRTNNEHMNEILNNICIPRVVGSPGHHKVRQYIKRSLSDLDWSMESNEFEDYTPVFGQLGFENIIARWNPNASRFLTLACHYDSKYEKDYEFVGATDSAVPCMQLINLAKVMRKELDSIKDSEVSLMLLFLDGEEAFKTWGPKDSIYGARHLAAKWHKKKNTFGNENNISDLDRIDLFILLDLIGARNPSFYNYFRDTSRWFSHLSKIETILANLKQFREYSYGRPEERYFHNYQFSAGIQDDHVPFLEKNVPILHLIPYPFPDFWHTPDDNRNAISMSTVENLNKILRVFVASYLHMEVEEENAESINRSEL